MQPFPANQPSRRLVLKGGVATAVGGLTGCASSGKPALDQFVRTVASDFGSQVASDTIFAALGVPNRLKFVSGRPMTQEDKQRAAAAQALIRASGAQVNELPAKAMGFNPTVPRRVQGLQATRMRPGMWEGSRTQRGQAQLERLKVVLARYEKTETLSAAQAIEVADAASPFIIAARALEEAKQGVNPTQVLVPPQSSVSMAARTGCLGAGLPLPRAGEGSRLVSVVDAVHPDQRATVEALLQAAATNPGDLYDVQYLIWNLIHADNSGYRRVFDKDISGRYRDLLDRTVPGGWRRYKQLVDEARERREAEEKKLALAKVALAQLSAICGMSFQLKTPGSGVGTGAYAENLLRQGFEQGTRDLSAMARNASRDLTNDFINQAFKDLGKFAPVARDGARAAQDGLVNGLFDSGSVFDPLQGYTLLAPDVAAHVSDVGGSSTGATLTLTNGSNDPFIFQAGSLGAVTPRLTQAQMLVPYIKDALGMDPYPPEDTRAIAWYLTFLRSWLNGKNIEYFDTGWKAWNAVKSPRFVPAGLRTVPVFGTMVALHTLSKWVGLKYFGKGDGKDIFGDQIDEVAVACAFAGLLPGLGTFAAVTGAAWSATDALFKSNETFNAAAVQQRSERIGQGVSAYLSKSNPAGAITPQQTLGVLRNTTTIAAQTLGDLGQGDAQASALLLSRTI